LHGYILPSYNSRLAFRVKDEAGVTAAGPTETPLGGLPKAVEWEKSGGFGMSGFLTLVRHTAAWTCSLVGERTPSSSNPNYA
jgi:hypothetical protein